MEDGSCDGKIYVSKETICTALAVIESFSILFLFNVVH